MINFTIIRREREREREREEGGGGGGGGGEGRERLTASMLAVSSRLDRERSLWRMLWE